MFTTFLLSMYLPMINSLLPPHPSPVVIKPEYNNNAGLANGSSITLYAGGRTINEMVATAIHEVAHNIDDGVLVGSGSQMSNFREFGEYLPANDPSLEYYKISWEHDKKIKGNFFCSRYGKTDPYEDFAECFTIYVINGSWFKQQGGEAVAKYEYIKALFGGREFLNETKDWNEGQYATTRAGFTIQNIFY